MKPVRFGLAGLGSMGRGHATRIHRGNIKGAVLTAVADPFSDIDNFADGVKGFRSSEEMIKSGEIDAVLIATPHYSHTELGIAALENGVHVLVEKPISVHKADAERLIAAHKDPKLVFAAMFNVRSVTAYQKLRSLIQSGELGKIHRINWIITTWYRTEAYYRSGGWRATWQGEGGGVLLNQCPHNLDLLYWLFGMPSKLRATCQFGKYHDIEVEDDVTAFLEYPDGATGVFITNTAEYPGTNRLEVACERGKVVLENGKLEWFRTEMPLSEHLKTASVWSSPDVWNIDIPTPELGGSSHDRIIQNVVDTINDPSVTLLAPGAEGIYSIELANAMLMSQFLGKEISLPLDGAHYQQLLEEKIAQSPRSKKS